MFVLDLRHGAAAVTPRLRLTRGLCERAAGSPGGKLLTLVQISLAHAPRCK
jgi:hypothetical protein